MAVESPMSKMPRRAPMAGSGTGSQWLSNRRPKADLHSIIDMLRCGPSKEIFGAPANSGDWPIYTSRDETVVDVPNLNGPSLQFASAKTPFEECS
jgi:hypothetical protein